MNELERIEAACQLLSPDALSALQPTLRKRLAIDIEITSGTMLAETLAAKYRSNMSAHLRDAMCEVLGVKSDAALSREIAQKTYAVTVRVGWIAAWACLLSLVSAVAGVVSACR